MTAPLYAATAGACVTGAVRLARTWADRTLVDHSTALAAERDALRALVAELVYDATHDPLTALLNRRGMERAWGSGPTPAVVCMIDLDGFKPINDTYGHPAGDTVLRTIGARLRAMPDVTACRTGGDELLVWGDDELLPLRVANAIEYPILIDHDNGRLIDLGVFGSIGTVDLDAPLPLSEVLRRADAAVYRAKNGPHRIVRWCPRADDAADEYRPVERLRDTRAGTPAAVPW